MARDTLENIAQKRTKFAAWPEKKNTFLVVHHSFSHGPAELAVETLLGMSHWAIFLNNFLFRIIQTSYHNLFKFSYPFLR